MVLNKFAYRVFCQKSNLYYGTIIGGIMSIKKLLVVFMLLFSTGALGDDLFDNSWGDSENEDSLKYNALENSWNYANEDDTLKYNAFENEWGYAGEDDTLKYNVFENKWDYAGEDDSLKYNPLENEWQFAD